MYNLNVCRWLDSNCLPLESEATTLPTEPPPLPLLLNLIHLLFRALNDAYKSVIRRKLFDWKETNLLLLAEWMWGGAPWSNELICAFQICGPRFESRVLHLYFVFLLTFGHAIGDFVLGGFIKSDEIYEIGTSDVELWILGKLSMSLNWR